LPVAIDRWLAVLRTDFSAWNYRFSLAEKKRRASSRSGGATASGAALSGEPVFALSLDVLLPRERIGTAAQTWVPLKDAVSRTDDRSVLRAPVALSSYLPEILSLSKKASVPLDGTRLVEFLDDSSRILSRLGALVALPKSLHRELKPRLVIRAKAGKKAARSLVSYLDLESLLSYEWAIAIGDEVVSAAEFSRLVGQKSALVRFRDGYVRLDPDEVSRLLKRALGSAAPGTEEFIRARFAGDSVVPVELETSLVRLFSEKALPPPPGLAATLRPYQLRGYNWAYSLLSAGFGCVLADDMGLGKTVQAIAVLLRMEEDGLLKKSRTLIVAPAALLSNWERELARFAPGVPVTRYHGAARSLSSPSRVFLTTYQTAVRDAAKISAHAFDFIVADEAHLMKNEETAASKTLKSIPARYRLALSGTPVENRLEDLRSIFDFALPGYLGAKEDFRRVYRVPIEVERDAEAAKRLKVVTAPFLLRRLKSDRAIIADLPEKITVNEYAALEKGQAALYESIVRSALDESGRTDDPLARSALILKLLTSLKQVCDHPRAYDKESPAEAGLSGKCGLLVALLEELLRGDEKALVFSQYVETLSILETIIRDELGENPLVYHGGLTAKKRDAAVESFQNDPGSRIMLVSLKAGGLGLNLTAASRVIHFDLWYNPAVENQATDRAFRIGQKRNVFVHRFITRNTFEEKIEAMLEAKRELAEMTVSTGESWLSRMSHDERKSLFRGDIR
jgi:SNF2 family DNA or RNA helicase